MNVRSETNKESLKKIPNILTHMNQIGIPNQSAKDVSVVFLQHLG
jgi:hypothetical protein